MSREEHEVEARRRRLPGGLAIAAAIGLGGASAAALALDSRIARGPHTWPSTIAAAMFPIALGLLVLAWMVEPRMRRATARADVVGVIALDATSIAGTAAFSAVVRVLSLL